MGKIVSTFLQGSVVTHTLLGGLTIYIIQLKFSYSVRLPKIVSSRQRYYNNRTVRL